MKNRIPRKQIKNMIRIPEDVINNIIRYYEDLMTEVELKALKHTDTMLHINLRNKKENKFREQERNYFLKIGRLTEDENILKLLAESRDKFRRKLATRIVIEHLNGEVYNVCPKCNELARTPRAKQCQHCFYTWHA